MKESLYSLREGIKEDRIIINAINRQINRLDGKEVVYSSREEDVDFLEWRAGIPPNAHRSSLVLSRNLWRQSLQEKQYEAAMIRLELPLTPCGFIVALIRAKCIQARQRKRNKRGRRKSGYR